MISKTGLYVVKALAALARLPEDTWIGTAELAEEIQAPMNYLGKLLHILAREKLVLSRKGVRGGMRLARAPDQISLYDVLEPFEHLQRWMDCPLGHDNCSQKNPCPLCAAYAPVRDRFLGFLQETTGADLAAALDGWPKR